MAGTMQMALEAEYRREAAEDLLDRCDLCGNLYDSWDGGCECRQRPSASMAEYAYLLACTVPVGAVRAARLGAYLLAGKPSVERKAKPVTGACTRCGGTGDLPCFRHVEGGVCFRCNGSGREPSREDLN